MKIINGSDRRISWNGTAGLQKGKGRAMPWRLLVKDMELFNYGEILNRVNLLAGTRITFATDSTFICLSTEPGD